ncbi:MULTISPECIES: DUF6678 family protein [Yersiniaceae]|jgi:hypothetical protein|uniref:DUF6678 family protein n=1 Tax=Yersiniaceae TaxID=1903411 RepID=UPI0010202CBA|nr:DUF6678 family protein [Yersinia intermedia]MBU9824391.1 hypothetical protein [Rahnella perminowiae]UJD89061.1 hypothetical protein FS594_09790 [Rahnella aquatilis]MCB5312403.1 hypothetical protein [Yersinia intermedia]MCB5326293.1 hypothetical protein [Yersinia intermedia]UZM69991.1 hypothetical protein OP861_15660 [Yersinia intermedia]
MLYSCMNNTKWNEIRLAMVGMESPPLWKMTFLNGYESVVDGEWFYHFREGGYLDIQYLDVLTNSVEQHATVGTILRAIHLPGMETSTGYRILGYADSVSNVDYL